MTEPRRKLVISFDDVPDDPPVAQAAPPMPRRLPPTTPRTPRDLSPLEPAWPDAGNGVRRSRVDSLPEWAYASWPRRVGAWLIDWLVLVMATIVLSVAVGGVLAVFSSGSAAAVGGLLGYIVFSFVVGLIYAPVLLSRRGAYNG